MLFLDDRGFVTERFKFNSVVKLYNLGIED